MDKKIKFSKNSHYSEKKITRGGGMAGNYVFRL